MRLLLTRSCRQERLGHCYKGNLCLPLIPWCSSHSTQRSLYSSILQKNHETFRLNECWVAGKTSMEDNGSFHELEIPYSCSPKCLRELRSIGVLFLRMCVMRQSNETSSFTLALPRSSTCFGRLQWPISNVQAAINPTFTPFLLRTLKLIHSCYGSPSRSSMTLNFCMNLAIT